MKPWLVSFLILIVVSPAMAQESAYTKLNLETDCVFHSQYEQGASGYCVGYKGYPVHLDEGDLRQMVRFGHVAKLRSQWESFSPFNRINDTIEWRLGNGQPYAAILRWFIENSNDNGEYTKALEGQVLVISKVADHNSPVSCVVGYVDARSNKNANQLARDVADTLSRNFACGKDKAEFHGARGKLTGQPVSSFE